MDERTKTAPASEAQGRQNIKTGYDAFVNRFVDELLCCFTATAAKASHDISEESSE